MLTVGWVARRDGGVAFSYVWYYQVVPNILNDPVDVFKFNRQGAKGKVAF